MARRVIRGAGWIVVVLAVLLPAACVPLLSGGGSVQPGAGASATPAPTEEITVEAVATAVVTSTGVTSATIDAGLLITPTQTITGSGPISPDHSIVGPVGEPQMHGTPAGNPATNDDSN